MRAQELPAAPANLLLVDDDPGVIQVLGRIVSKVGRVRFATNGTDALRLVAAEPPDLILLDAEMPGMGGFDVCKALKREDTTKDIPVIFVTSHRNEAFEVEGFRVGAADFITKPVSPQLVLARVGAQLQVKRMTDQLRQLATVDALTSLANRRRLDDALSTEWLRAKRTRSPLSLVLVDVDHFKLYNDRYGHPAGDACLRSVSQALLSASLRPADLVARYGGEEFGLLLPQTPADGALHVAERILEAIQLLELPHETSPIAPFVTVSAGIAHFGDTPKDWSLASSNNRASNNMAAISPRTLIETADRALYSAKEAGRAQACVVPLKPNVSLRHGEELVDSRRVAISDRGC